MSASNIKIEVKKTPFSLIWQAIKHLEKSPVAMDALKRMAEIEDDIGNNAASCDPEYLRALETSLIENHKCKQKFDERNSKLLGSTTGSQFIYNYFKGRVTEISKESAMAYYKKYRHVDMGK